ncbi:MAG: DUF3048 domain-containing protein [Acidimicrobiia bacterium]
MNIASQAATAARCRFPRLVVSSVVLLTLATACSGGGDDGELGAGGGRTTTTAPKFFPLTGLAADSPTTVTRQAITVKIENSPASRPQAGLDKADVVYEAVVEGGQTRFLAVFHSTDADQIGPVRSVRPTDPSIVDPFGGIVAYSGGIPRFVEAMKATGLTNYDETTAGDAFRRRRDKSAPHNLYTSTGSLYSKGPHAAAPPKFAEFLPPGQAFAPAGATPVAGFSLAIGSSTRADFAWDAASSTWKRSTNGAAHNAEGGGQLAPDTVIVQFVPYEGTGEVDTTGAQVSEAKVIGSGEATIFAGGVMVRARWSKPNSQAMTAWTDLAGAPIALPAGRTWVELPATGTALTTR